MKTARNWICLGVIVIGLIHGHASLRAQPAGDPTPPGGEAAPSEGASVPTDEDPIVTDEPDKPWSQGVPITERQAARALFLEGNRLVKNLLLIKAIEQYNAALRKWKHPAFYLNLAVAQISLGQEVEGRENLERALVHGQEPLGAEEFKEAQKRLREVEAQLGRIRVSCQTPGAEVTLDGVALFTGPGSYQGWIKPKAHEVTAKKAGYLSEARRVEIVAGRLQDIELKLVTLSQATEASRRWAAWKPWAVVAVGGAIVAAGGGLHALASRTFTEYDNEFRALDCAKGNPPPGCMADEPGLAELSTRLTLARREQAFAVGGYIAGGSLIAAGIVLLYLNRPRLAEQGASSLSARSLEVIPDMSGDRVGISVSISH